jgi:predicted metal-dependent hydrolase
MSPDCTDSPPELLREGIGQFNRGAYFACHETLEELWAGEQAPVRDLYQGLLQVAVALHHLENGNYKGALFLFRKGRELLRHVEPVCLGVDVRTLMGDVDAVRASLEAHGPDGMERVPRALFPRIRMLV